MGRKFQKNSLTGEMTSRLLLGLAAGVFLILLVGIGGVHMLKEYFHTSGYYYDAEMGRAKELQAFVRQNGLAATDSEPLRQWAMERKIDEFFVLRDDLLLLDISYEGDIAPGAGKMHTGTVFFYYMLEFADGEASVYLYEGAGEEYFTVLWMAAVLIGFSACLGIFISGIQEYVRYIRQLEKEVAIISRGELQGQVTVSGENELARLAGSLEVMRRTLVRNEQTERELRQAQTNLLLGMSHDLKTPLTGLMAYMEIIRKQEKEGRPAREYIDKAFDKILQIRAHADRLFELFLIDSRTKNKMEPAAEVYDAIGDYLSEMLILLETDGFMVNTENVGWEPVRLTVSAEYMGRITNNIISNINKYGDRTRPVRIELRYEPERVGVLVQNGVGDSGGPVEGTGIGVKNISMMMEQMGGSAETEQEEGNYSIALWFPVYDKESEV